MVIAGAAGAGFYGFEHYRLEQVARQQIAEDLKKCEGDNLQFDEKLRNSKAELARTSVDVRSNRRRFTQNAEEAEDLAKQLRTIVGEDRSDVEVGEAHLTLRIADAALFKTGTATLSAEGTKILDKIGELLAERRERDILVEGHTSDQPVSEVAKGYDTNWEFTSARALSVVRYFHDEVGIDPDRLSGSAMAEYRPVSRNSKAKNRRVDLVLMPRELRRVED
jgi:chemotaxis protein MotB